MTPKLGLSAREMRSVRHGRRSPEVIVRVISPGGNCLKTIRQHFGDLQKGQNRSLEMDFVGTPVVGSKAARGLVESWVGPRLG